MNVTAIKKVIARNATATKGEERYKNFKTPSELIEEAGWGVDEINSWDFIPLIGNDMFADIVKFLLDGGWREVSGNFYINPSSQEIEYVSLADSDKANSVAVDVSADGAARRLFEDRRNGIEPNGQWHTHPHSSAFWSSTDVRDQIKDIELASAFFDSGERYYMCVGSLHIAIRRVRWDENGVRYVDSPAYLENGRQIAPSTKYPYTHSPQSGAGIADDSLIRGVDDILDLAPLMATNPDLHEDLSIYEKSRILNLVNKRYGNLYKITEYLGTITITEAVNKVFAMYGVELGDELLADRSNHALIGLLEGKEVEESHEEIELW